LHFGRQNEKKKERKERKEKKKKRKKNKLWGFALEKDQRGLPFSFDLFSFSCLSFLFSFFSSLVFMS